jgi:predicted nuclease of predicted toxin-antitoxin system
MRILLDECLDWRLCRILSGHQCISVGALGWSGLSNGKLMQKAEQEFDVFLTGDRNLLFQQNLARFDLAVIVLQAPTTRLFDTLPLMSKVLVALTTIRSKEIVLIRPDK